MHFLKSFNREKSTQDEKVHFIKGNELKLTQVELSSFFFKSVGQDLLAKETQKKVVQQT